MAFSPVHGNRLGTMCGLFGIYGHDEAANLAYLGLHALQHRGQESAGIVTLGDGQLRRQVGMGLVSETFGRETISSLPGRAAVGQVRYSTTGGSETRNAQPFMFEYAHGTIAIAHNGNLINAPKMRHELEQGGSIFQTTSDTEVIIHLLAQAKDSDTVGRLVSALQHLLGAYSLLLLTESRMIAVRDPFGFRPLVLGRLKDSFVFASETSAFDLIEAEFIREIEPGEIVEVSDTGLRSSHALVPKKPPPKRFCVFEHVYFARPDSHLNNLSVYRSRIKMGRQLASESPVPADVVIPVPDSGVAAAIGYARESGIPFENGLIRSHYVGRTFIEPQDSIRHFGVRLKLSPVRDVVDGKRVVVVDDSLVRGTTSRKIVKMLRTAGAKEVHLRVSAPPTTHSCYYGIDTPTQSELIASSHSVEEIARYVTCDSLAYLTHDGLMKSVESKAGEGYCSACFTGNYPVLTGSPSDESQVVDLQGRRQDGQVSGIVKGV